MIPQASHHSEAFPSVFHSPWWAVVTLTAVGYGDVTLVTVGGNVFTFFVLAAHCLRKALGESSLLRLNWRLKLDKLLKPQAKQISQIERLVVISSWQASSRRVSIKVC